MKGHTKEAIEFLTKFSPNDPWVLTSIIPDGKTDTATFTEKEAAFKWVEERQGKQNIYFHVNPTTRPMNSKASKEDIDRLEWLHVDIDPRAGEQPAREKQRAIKLLKSHATPPTVIIDSGGGVQGFWKLEPHESLIIGGDLDKAKELEAYNVQFEREFQADPCHNVDRIMRLPGTINLPTQRKIKKGRKPAIAKLVEWAGNVYNISEFTPAVRVQAAKSGLSEGKSYVHITGNVPDIGVEELQKWAAENNKIIPEHTLALIATGQDPVDPTRYGSRSESLFRVCCDLVRAGVPEEMIYAIITGDNEIAVSVRDKKDWERYASRQIQRAKEEAIHPMLRVMNEKHAVISDIGGKCKVISEIQDPVLKRTKISKQAFLDIRNRYCNQQVQVGVNDEGEPVYKALGTFWINHPERRQYDSIIFSPGKDVEGCYNLWKGFAVEAKKGNKHEAFLKHIYDNICSANKEYYDYLVGWMARLVQKPDVTGQIAVVLRGKKGTGKSFFAKNLGELLGRHYMQVSDSKHLVGSFNAHLRDTVLLFGDEAFFAGDKRHESVLKTLVTEEHLVIEGKGVDAEVSPNYTHLVLASNEEWVIPAGMDERRFFVLEVGEACAVKHSYFKNIQNQLNTGGHSSLLHYLLTYDLSEFEVRNYPKTEALSEQKVFSMEPKMQWFLSKVEDGALLPQHSSWKKFVSIEALYFDYISNMKDQARSYRMGKPEFAMFIERCLPVDGLEKKKRKMPVQFTNENNMLTTIEKMVWTVTVPDLESVRAHWDKNLGGPYKWHPVSQDQDDDDQDFIF